MGAGPKVVDFVQRIHALSGGAEVRRKACARELGRTTPADATELIHDLLVLARSGADEDAACVLSYVVQALQQEAQQIPYASRLRTLADMQELGAVAALFTEAAPAKEMDLGAARKRDAQTLSDSLGHQKQRARITQNPDALTRYLASLNGAVIREALQNPRLTEAQVVRVAARRPTRPEVLEEVWRAAKWNSRHAVRRALALNPYLPPAIGTKLLPLLNAVDLKEISNDAELHQSLRAQARRLLAEGLGRRPPNPPASRDVS